MERSESRLQEMGEKGHGEEEGRNCALEMELAEMREIKSKQEAVEQELFKQIAEKEQENESLVRLISNKERKIE